MLNVGFGELLVVKALERLKGRMDMVKALPTIGEDGLKIILELSKIIDDNTLSFEKMIDSECVSDYEVAVKIITKLYTLRRILRNYEAILPDDIFPEKLELPSGYIQMVFEKYIQYLTSKD